MAGLAQRATADVQRGRADIDALFEALRGTTRVTLGEPDVKDIGDGTSDVLAPVKWEVSAQPLLTILNKYFWGQNHAPLGATARSSFRDTSPISDDLWGDQIGQKKPVANAIEVESLWNRAEDPKRPFSPDLLVYLTSKVARIRVSGGRHSATLTFAAGRKCFVGCSDFGHDRFQVQLHNRGDQKLMILSEDQNPIRIPRVPTAELGAIAKLAIAIEVAVAPASSD